VAIQALLVILAVLLVLLFLGVPISYAIAVSSLTAILSSIDLNVAVLTAAQRTFVGMSKFSLTAIPFFILAGNIMNQGGIAKRLVDFVMAILGKMPGALLVTNIGTNALFGAISGSAVASTASLGSILIPALKKEGYGSGFSGAIIAAAGSLGPIIPPSILLVIYGCQTGLSIGDLFMAGPPVFCPPSRLSWWCALPPPSGTSLSMRPARLDRSAAPL
jgi:tripartite ATP-independent transporter DctM subunit